MANLSRFTERCVSIAQSRFPPLSPQFPRYVLTHDDRLAEGEATNNREIGLDVADLPHLRCGRRSTGSR